MKAKVNPTEDLNKVKSSIKNITTAKKAIDLIITDKINDEYLSISGDIYLLNTISSLIKSNEITEVASNILNKNKTENSLKFYVNKQAAYHNKFHMSDEDISTLGDIEVTIKTMNPDDVIHWIIN
ncbi:RNA-binding domain-containing protein [Methanosphaera sp. WGK6]|uniref:RNA-binding domain-containing protein n=1 Tax=Methanosphaera sp. WGK6 TaxID=1561964 RepID=UPI001F523C8B|nr:RNA-binding domain-containing protein [Methanosphaera sp. WGK6]